MKATFKPFEIQDIPTVVPMMEEFYAIDNYPIEPEVTTKMMHEFIENEHHGKGWLILVDRQVMGYIILTFVFSFEYKGRIAFLDELFISSKARGMGLGKQALDFIHDQAIALSLKILYLEVEPHNKIAQSLYLSKNFNIHNRGLMKLVVKP